jgi:hypothetical protein
MPAGPRPGSPAQRGNRPARPAAHASARSPRAGRRGGVLVGGSAVARRWQGVAGYLEGVTGKVPGKEERTGVHRNGGSTVRRCQRRRAATFVGGEGAPVVADGGDEVLQLGRGEGVRDLQEISGIGRPWRSSPGSGGRWRCSAKIHEGEGAVGGRTRRSRCGGAVGKLGRSREGVGEEWGREDESTRSRLSGAVVDAAERERKEGEKVGVPGVGVPRGAGGAVGPGPDWRASPGSGPSVALVGDVCRARACRSDRAGREGAKRWAVAQCQVAVPLTGGAGLSAGAVEMNNMVFAFI